MKKYLALILVLSFAAAFIACGDNPSSSSSNSDPTLQNPNDTPTEAYKRLFAAVKSKNTEAIKAEFSKSSIAAAESQAARTKTPVENVYRNGFTATTLAERLPEIRDERVSGLMGALEVWNARENKWEDLPFVREESGWKLAIGDIFAGKWTSPGRGRASRELEASNAISGNRGIINGAPNANANFNANLIMSNSNGNATSKR